MDWRYCWSKNQTIWFAENTQSKIINEELLTWCKYSQFHLHHFQNYWTRIVYGHLQGLCPSLGISWKAWSCLSKMGVSTSNFFNVCLRGKNHYDPLEEASLVKESYILTGWYEFRLCLERQTFAPEIWIP